MKVNTKLVLKDYDGKALTHTESDGTDDREVNGKVVKVPKTKEVDTDLKHILMIAATNSTDKEILPAETKSKLHEIAIKIATSHEPDLTENERNLLKVRVDALWPNSVILYGIVCDIFDEKTRPAAQAVVPTAPAQPSTQTKEAGK